MEQILGEEESKTEAANLRRVGEMGILGVGLPKSQPRPSNPYDLSVFPTI